MAHPGRYVDQAVGTHRTLVAFEDRGSLALDEGKDLVDVLVHFLADLALRRDAHHHDLGVGADREHLPEEPVRLGCFDDVDIERHAALLGSVGETAALETLACRAICHDPWAAVWVHPLRVAGRDRRPKRMGHGRQIARTHGPGKGPIRLMIFAS